MGYRGKYWSTYNIFLRRSPGGASGAFAKNPTEEDYDQLYPESYYASFYLCVVYLFVLHFIGLSLWLFCYWCDKRKYDLISEASKKYQKVLKIYRYNLEYIFINIIISMYVCFVIGDNNENYQVCRYPFECQEGQNNTIISNYYYYAIPRKDVVDYCPSMEKMLSVYVENNDWKCISSIYGCCKFNNMCDIYQKYNLPYDQYNNNRDESMFITFDMEKYDGPGDRRRHHCR